MQRKFPDRSLHISHHGVNGNSVTHRFENNQTACIIEMIFNIEILILQFLRKITDQKRIAMSEKNNSNNCGWGNVTVFLRALINWNPTVLVRGSLFYRYF